MAFFHVQKQKGKSSKRGVAGKLARLSEKGRRRENTALFTALFLLFLFTGALVSWISIAKKTETEQRFDAYGEWKAAFYGVDEARAEAYIDNPLTTKSGVSKIVGSITSGGAGEKIEEVLEIAEGAARENPESAELSLPEKMMRYMGVAEMSYEYYLGICGTLGTLDAGCIELGRISMEEGKFPESADEIAMTRSQLERLGLGGELGQEIELEVITDSGETALGRWRLCGILEAYGAVWKTKGYPVASAVISEEALAAFPWEFSYNVFTDVDGIVGDTRFIYKMSEEPMDVISHFAFNDSAYDFWGQTDEAYFGIMLLAVVLAAAATVFQSLGAQIRKRSRQVGLLKAIGATNVQVRGIFLRELIGVLWKAALPGTVCGVMLVPAVLWGSGLAGKRRMYYGLNVPFLLGAVFLCCATACLGALIPVWKGSRIPIRGEILPKTVKFRPMKKGKKYSPDRLAAGRGSGGFRAAMVLLLAAVVSFIFLALYQVEKEMAPYRNGEKSLYYHLGINNAMYQYREKDRIDNSLLEQFAEIPGVEAVYTRKNGVNDYGNFYISYEGIEDCELERMRKNWDSSPYAYLYNKPYHKKTNDRAMAHIMGIYTGWESNLEGLGGLVAEGDFDLEAFEAGEEVLLFLPPYREMDNRAVTEEMSRLTFNTDKRYQDFYEPETCVKPGDTITLIVNETIMDDSGNETWNQDAKPAYQGTREVPVKVGGIIRYLPQDTKNPLWNEAYKGEPWEDDVLQLFTVVADSSLVNELRELDIEMRMEHALESLGESETLEDWQLRGIRGENFSSGMVGTDTPFSCIEVLCDTSASEATQSSIEGLAEEYGLYKMVLENTGGKTAYELWKEDYQEAFNRSLVYLMAAVAGGFVFICLLLQTASERLAEDRKHLGIFQAMGIRGQEVRRGYIRKGLWNGIFALLLAHGILAGFAVWQSREAAAKLSPYRFVNGREAFLYRFDLWFGSYDWRWHILACLLTLVFAAALYWMPLRGILKNSPVENIRELEE